MSNDAPVPAEVQDLIDDYLDGLLDEDGTRRLEQLLLSDARYRAHFVRYSGLHTGLALAARAGRATARALRHIGETAGTASSASTPVAPRRARRRGAWRLRVAAAVLVAGGLTWWAARAARPGGGGPAGSGGGGEIAWLVNAQNCQWVDGTSPVNLAAGRTLGVRQGLAEIRFRNGATIVLEGPAELQLVSGSSAKLLRGKLTARVPEEAKGFQVASPAGRVVDLGTEFGIAVADDGAADVVVFDGKVEAYGAADRAGMVSLLERQAARIDATGVSTRPADPGHLNGFTRSIVPPPVVVARTAKLDFARSADGGVRDVTGVATGITHRLPGTGTKRPADDPHVRLDTGNGRLWLTTTRSDINTQFQLDEGEYLGFRLGDLGFTGVEDFEVSAVIHDVPGLAAVGQFGLYVGPRSDRNIRGGLISRRESDTYRQFLVNNDAGRDRDAHYVGLVGTGNDVRLTLRRRGGSYSMSVENLTSGASSTLAIAHPTFLADERELYVGLFGANTGSEHPATLAVDELSATVWTVSDTAADPAIGR